MRVSRKYWSAAVLLAAAFVCASAAATWESSRIELKNGTVYENCSFDVDDVYKTLKLTCDSTVKHVSFTDVARIVDPAGNDITVDILEGYYDPKDHWAEPAPSDAGATVQPAETTPEGQAAVSDEGNAEESQPRARKPYSAYFCARAGWGFPLGDFFEGISGGPGGGLDISIAINRQTAVRISGFYSRHATDVVDVTGGEEVSNDVKMGMFRFMVGAEYYDWPNWRSGGNTSWHAYSQLGFTSYSFSGEAIVYDPYYDEYYLFTGNGSETKFTMSMTLGLLQRIAPEIGLTADASYDLLFVGSDGYGNVAYASVLDFRVGFAILIK